MEKSEKFFNTKFDIIFDLDVTSPLREIKDIRNAKKNLFEKNTIALLVFATREKILISILLKKLNQELD